MNYDVTDDMEVIDFEKDSDFLLFIPEQDNYLNLRFLKDGSFMYNFLIPESKEKLSIDQKQQKLHEMEKTCQQFKSILHKLADFGLKIDLDKEISVSEKALIQLPKKYQKRIKSVTDKKIKKQEEKKMRLYE